MIILAAGQGERLWPLTDTCPKCLVELGGRSLLDWQLRAAQSVGIKDVVVVGGYRAEQLERPGIKLIVNPEYQATNMVYSLFCAQDEFGDEFILSYGDIAYSSAVLRALLDDSTTIGVVVDRDWQSYWEIRFDDPLRDAESLRLGDQGRILSIGQKEEEIERIEAQYIGLIAFRGSGVAALKQAYRVAREADQADQMPFGGVRSLATLYMTDMLQGMIDLGYSVSAVTVHGGWVEIDNLHDLKVAEQAIADRRLILPCLP